MREISCKNSERLLRKWQKTFGDTFFLHTVVSDNIKLMQVFAEVPEKRDFKRQWGRASCARL